MYTAIFYAQLLFIRQKKQRKFTGAKAVHNKLETVCTAVAFSCQGERIFSTIFPKSEKAKRKKTREQILDTETIEYRYFSLFIFISCYIIYSFSKILLWPTLNDKMFSTICCHNGVRVLDKKCWGCFFCREYEFEIELGFFMISSYLKVETLNLQQCLKWGVL